MTATISDSPPAARRAPTPARPLPGAVVMRGRAAELRLAHDLLRRAERGNGGVLLVEGEQGIGKSLLLREAVSAAAERGFSLAVDAADQLSHALPLFALRRALGEPFAEMVAGSLDQELSAAPGWWIDRMRAHLAVRAASVPVLVCLDDLQWACPATLAALGTLPRELKRHPVVWVLARSGSAGPDAAHLFTLLENDGAIRTGLGPLTTDGVTELLTDAFGAPPDERLRALAADAAGNPWLLAELVSGLRDEGAVRVADGQAALVSDRLPERLRRVARQRLSGIGEQARHLLLTAAMLGSSFRLEDAAEMLGVGPAVLLPAVEETMSAGITTVASDTFAFRHQLLRRAVGDLIPAPGRRALHRQYGQLLLGRGESPVLAARHLMRAADPGHPGSLADLDTAVARTLPTAPRTAAVLAAHALELTAPGEPAELPRTVAAATALAAAGRPAQAERVARDALAKPLPPLAEARLRCALSAALCARGLPREAAAEARLVLAQPELPADLRDHATVAHLQALAGAHDELADALSGAVAGKPAGDDGHVAAAALVARAVIAWDKGRVGQALELARDAARRETAVAPDARRVQPLLVLAAMLLDLRRLDEAEAVLDAAGGEALCATPAESAACVLRARMQLARGSLTAAAAAGQRALTVAETLEADGYASAARRVLAMIALRGGDVSAAARHLAADAAPGPGFAGIYARADTMLAAAQVSAARDGAAAVAGQIRRVCAELPARPGRLLGDPVTAAWLTRSALAAGEDALAAAVAAAASELAAAAPEFPAATAAAAHSRGIVSQEPAALAAAASGHPDPWARASAAEDLGVLFAKQARPERAIESLTQAVQGYQLTAAAADTARVRRRLRELGVRRRHWSQSARRPATGWDSLTDAERTASELVAQGLNNRQIASRMYVSVHTVAFYMRQIFRKLGVGSRVELARIVVEQGPADVQER